MALQPAYPDAIGSVSSGVASYPETLAATHPYIAARHYPLFGFNNGYTMTTQAAAANRADLHCVVFDRAVTFDRLGVYVTTGAAGNVKVLVYSSDVSGWPDAKIYESGNLDTTASSNFAYATASLPSFVEGTRYWIGIISDATATLRGIAANGRGFGLNSVGDATVAYCISRTGLTFATPPATWTFVASDLSIANRPIVIGRAA